MSDSNTSTTLSTTLLDIQEKTILCLYPLFFIFGLSGCIFNLFIFSRRKLRKTSCCIYFFAASTDHLFTLTIGISTVLATLNHSDPQIESAVFCKIRGYIFQVTLMLSRWFVAVACIDRYASCSHKLQLRNFAKPRTALRIIVVIIVFWSIVCTHRLIFYEVQRDLCGIFTNTAAATYHSVYVVIGGGVLPVTIMTACALLIRQNLRLKQKNQSSHLNQIQRNSLDQQVLNLLFIQVACYVIFTTPQLCNLIFSAFSNSISLSDKSQDRLTIEKFVAFLAETVLYLFPVTSFYLYTLTSPTFRKEFMECLYLVPLLRKCLRNRPTPVQHVPTISR